MADFQAVRGDVRGRDAALRDEPPQRGVRGDGDDNLDERVGDDLGAIESCLAAVVDVVNRTLKTFPPRFVIAKGGITSSDVAAHGLEIRHGIVRGPMLPGIVSLWEPVDGPAKGIPYIVFAGNVGDDESLAQVTRKLSNTF